MSTGAHVSASGTVSIANGGSGTAITFDTETRDDGGCWASSPNPTRLTVPSGAAGWYAIAGYVFWSGNNTGNRVLSLLINSTTTVAKSNEESGSAHNDLAQCVGALHYLSVGDYVELVAYQNSGSALNVQAGTKFSWVRVA